MSLANVKKGDTVCHVDYGWRRGDAPTVTTAEVTGAGPKYISIGKSRFYRESGAHVSDYSPRMYVYATREEWEAKKSREGRESKCGALMRQFRADRADDETLSALIALLEPKP